MYNNIYLDVLSKLKNIIITYNFEVTQSGVWNNVLREPSLIVLPICVLEPYVWIKNDQ